MMIVMIVVVVMMIITTITTTTTTTITAMMMMMAAMMMMMMMIPTEGTASMTILARTFSNGPGAPNEVPLVRVSLRLSRTSSLA